MSRRLNEVSSRPEQPWPDAERLSAADAPWLDERETAAWVALAAMMAALPAALDAQLRRDAGMSLVDYQVLSWLSMCPGRAMRMTVLAEMATVSQSHLSRVAARLERRGWLRRTPDPDDGRGTLAELTEPGWDAVVDSAPGHVAEAQRLVFGHLPADRVRQVEEIGRAVLEAVRPGYCLRIPRYTTGRKTRIAVGPSWAQRW